VRSLRAQKVFPKLAIVQVKEDPAIDVYVSLKQKYGDDIEVDVDVHKIAQTKAPEVLKNSTKMIPCTA
jgi:5,10-methylene-tetrahydrofolate dehydrogenase/methenyl tetrahydrofolate cyclohydrolase